MTVANELTVGLTAEYEDAVGMYGTVQGVEEVIVSPATTKNFHTTMGATTSPLAVELGDVATPGTLILVNRDPTNFVSVLTGTGGVIFAKLWPQGSTAGINFCALHLGSGCLAPFLQANTANCAVEVFLVPL